MNPCPLKSGILSDRFRRSRVQRVTVPVLALCLAILTAAAPAHAQQASQAAPATRQHADALHTALGMADDQSQAASAGEGRKSLMEQILDRQHLKTPLIGRIPVQVHRAAAGERARRMEQPTIDDILQTVIASRLGPHAAPVQTVPVTSTVQTSDLTYPGYVFSTNGTLRGMTPNNIDPFISPSERYVYFVSSRVSTTDPAPGTEYHIFRINSSGDPTSLVQLTGLSTEPTVSAAGEAFAGERYPFVINDNLMVYTQQVVSAGGTMHYDLYEATLGTSGVTGISQITGLAVHTDATKYELYQTINVAHPSYSNGQIAFAGTALNSDESPVAGGVPSHIYLYSTSSATFVQLTTGTADDENPSLSPDQPIVAFDSNVGAAGYTRSGTAAMGELVSASTKATRDIWLVQTPSGAIVNQFTTTASTPYNNIQPVWTQTTTNPYINNAGSDLYLFFSSNRGTGFYDINFLRAQDTTPTPPNGQLVVDLEGQDNQLTGTNIAALVNTSSPTHHTSDSLAIPINNTQPTISILNSVLSVIYTSNRYVINNVSDNPLDPDDELTQVGKAGYPALPAAAQDNEPTNLTTDAASASQGSAEILASRIVDIDPPTLLPYDATTGEVIHVEDQTAQIGLATRLVGTGSTAQFIVRLSDRQTGIGKAFLQIKDPNSKYQQQSSPQLEHKVYTRNGGLSAPYTMHDKEFDESTTLFSMFTNFAFGLNSSTTPLGDQVVGASVAGSNGGQTIETGDLLVYPRTYPQVNTVVNMAPVTTTVTTTQGPTINYTTVIVNATNVIDDFAAGDTLLVNPTTAGAPPQIATQTLVYQTTTGGVTTTTVINPITNNMNGTYTFLLANMILPAQMPMLASVIVEDAPVTTATTQTFGGMSGFTSLTVGSVANFQIGDTLSVPGAATPMILNGMSGPSNGTYTMTVSLANGQTVQGGGGVGATVTVVARFDPQGQEVDCEAIDAGIDYTSGGAPVYPTVSNFTVPVFTPGYEDSVILSGQGTLADTPDVNTQTGPINRASGNAVWLQLEPFIVNSTVAVATIAKATILPVENTSGIVPGDTVQVGTEQAVVVALAVAAQQTGIPNGTPELVFDSGAPLQVAHAAGEAVTLISSPSGGVLYSATWVTPATPSDYFIDAIAYDNAAFPLTNGDGVTTPFYFIGSDYNGGELNWRIYDNIWGFSTLPFTPSSGPSVLVVSDYALPQKFFKGRFGTSGANNLPFTYFGAESYLTDIEVDNGGTGDYLSGIVSDSQNGYSVPENVGNYGGVSHAVTPSFALSVGANTGIRGIIASTGIPIGYPNGLGVNSYIDADQSNIATGDASSGALLPSSQRYDIWRILARGPIPSNVLNAYGPTITTQPDPADAGSHPVQVANDAVIWVSPFSGNQFSGNASPPLGTITDPNTQATIETFLNNGGRFFIEGQDIGFALTGNSPSSSGNNIFLTDYLKAQFLNDTSTFTTGAYVLSAGSSMQNVISNDAYRNATGDRQHRRFRIANSGGVDNYLPPSAASAVGVSFQAPTVSHTPFSLTTPQEPSADTTTRTDGSMDDGYGDISTFRNAAVQGNLDSTNTITGASGIVYQSAAADLAGSGSADRLLYYIGDVPLTLASASTTALAIGTTTISLVVPTGSSASALLNEFTANDTFVLDTGTNAETVIVKSSAISTTGVPVITLMAATTKTHAAGVTLARSASTDFTNFVGYSSFGLEAISQELAYNIGYTSISSKTNVFSSANHRTNIIHNLICTTRTGTITGLITNTSAPQPGVLVEAQLEDVITGVLKTYTAISDGSGHYQMQGVLPGLYAFAISGGYVGVHQVLSTYVHGGDTLTQDIQVNPAPTGSVVVNVTDKLTKMPIGGVQVTLTEIHGAFTYTGTTATTTNVNTGAVAGQVTFPTVAPSLYTITYVKSGYDVSNPPDSTGPAQTPPNLVTVTQGTPLQVATILSPAPATVFGLATTVGGSNNGLPLQGVTITFTGPPGTFTTTSGPSFRGPDSTTTIIPANYPLNDDATFGLPATPSGVTYTYTATLAGYVTLTGSIIVTSGESHRLDLPMTLAGDILLIVNNAATGKAITTPVTATVTAPGGTTTTVVSGGASVSVIPNTAPGYTVTLPASVGGESQTKAVTAGDTTTYTFTITPAPGAITGTVTDLSSGSPITGAVVTITNASGAKLTSAATGANGIYTIANVPSGLTYTASVTAPGYTSPAPVTGLAISPGMTLTQNFMLSSIYGSVSGTVTDSVTGLGVSGASVTVSGGGHTYTGTTNSSGSYLINTVLAGVTYAVTVSAASYQSQSKSVTVAVSQAASASFVLVSNIIHRYPSGLQMFSAPYDYSGQALASILMGEVSKTTGAPVNLVAAWLPGASTYALTPTSPCETLHLGQGYWARFGASGGVLMATGKTDTAPTTAIVLQAGWNMIGDPYTASTTVSSLEVQDSAGNTPISFTTATSASVNFVDPQLYSYDTATNTYTLVEINNPFGGNQKPSIDPYVGYWIYAYTNCSLIFTKPT